ncbi:MAG TPA: hypothetical protein VKA15_01965, partial [Isosphaeraceae bacterium]|nr:hypothetical protein [Isosphaeraceae bacterium]
SAISTGCLRTAIVRPSPEPAPDPSSSAKHIPGDRAVAIRGRGQGQVVAPAVNEAPPVAGASPGTATPLVITSVIPPPPPVITPPKDPSAVAPIELEAAPIESRAIAASHEPRGAPATTPARDTAADPDTPMLDAANRRLAAVTRQQRESRDDDAAPPAAPGDGMTALKSRAQFREGEPPGEPILKAARTKPRPPRSEPTSTKNDAAPAQPPAGATLPIQPPAPATLKEKERRPEQPEQHQPGAADPPSTGPLGVSALEDCDPLGISELRLCRKVSGFGSFEPLNENSVKAGQPLLIYCEMTGLRYEAKDDGFVSRVSSRIEIRAAGGGPIQWEHELGAGEDVCRRRRHDYYVNYLVDLPKSLAPGSYGLRLTQTDVVASRSTSAEIPLNISP